MASRVLITAASKYGATKEMAGTIADVMGGRGLKAEFLPLDEIESVRAYDAVIVGSAVYLGRWMTMGREFLTRHRADLLERAVWLYSSGPIADHGEENQMDVEELLQLVDAREHKLFRGSIARRNLSVAERLLIMSLGVNDGDYRDWAEIRAWADGIAGDLTNRTAPV